MAQFGISEDASHHVYQGRPAYPSRFHEVQKFHEPGLAPVRDASGAYHITPEGLPAYVSRYIRTFGFYEGRAAVHSYDGWFHIIPDGISLYGERFAWCGNFQESRCAVRDPDGDYLHIAVDGTPAYVEHYRYAGDFKDGYAVVQREDGKHTHIDRSGNPLHGRWFQDLDVFHKRYARACDSNGWHHVDMTGEPLYGERFRNVEPFYNGQARVEAFDGSLSVINESGQTLVELRGPSRSHLEELSGDMVGLWRTQTIHAAVELGVFESLPASAKEVERQAQLHRSVGTRLMRALMELGLVWRGTEGSYFPTERGSLLRKAHPLSLADAARHWGRESLSGVGRGCSITSDRRVRIREVAWRELPRLDSGQPRRSKAYHSAMSTYARHDYRNLADSVDFTAHDSILDAGGGTGELAFALLRSCPDLVGTVMDRAEVVEGSRPPAELDGRCRFVAGDLFGEWPVRSDAVILARVLHDWSDSDALRILIRAREAMPKDGTLYVVEMAIDEETGQGGMLDLNMLVMTQGAERTEEQFRNILGKTGFILLDVIETGAVSSIIRARAL